MKRKFGIKETSLYSMRAVKVDETLRGYLRMGSTEKTERGARTSKLEHLLLPFTLNIAQNELLIEQDSTFFFGSEIQLGETGFCYYIDESTLPQFLHKNSFLNLPLCHFRYGLNLQYKIPLQNFILSPTKKEKIATLETRALEILPKLIATSLEKGPYKAVSRKILLGTMRQSFCRHFPEDLYELAFNHRNFYSEAKHKKLDTQVELELPAPRIVYIPSGGTGKYTQTRTRPTEKIRYK